MNDKEGQAEWNNWELPRINHFFSFGARHNIQPRKVVLDGHFHHQEVEFNM